jgi:outer membrane murein-binding lipoprotein Lpp
MKKISLLLVVLVIVFSVLLTGCSSSSGIPQADYDAVKAQLSTAQSQVTQVTTERDSARQERLMAQESAAQLQKSVDDLTAQILALKEKYETKGATALETVAKLVKYYSDTHYYIKDVYDCNNYACDFWDILMQAGINTEEHPTQIIVGSIEKDITSILSSDHAWVIVDLGDDTKVAADATGGIVITQAENPRYYKGWAFNNPADLKANDDLRATYNATGNCINVLLDNINTAGDLFNSTQLDKYWESYNQLLAFKAELKTLMDQIMAQIESFSVKL